MNKRNELTQLLECYIELQELLEKDSVNLDAINIKLKQIADVRIEAQLNVMKSNEDNKVKLNPDHLEVFKHIRSTDSLMGLPPFSVLM